MHRHHQDCPDFPLEQAADRLTFVVTDCASFGTLDNIAGLGLPLVSNDTNGNNISTWYQTKQLIPSKMIIEGVSWTYNQTIDHEQWSFIYKSTRVAVLYVNYPYLTRSKQHHNIPLCGIISTTPKDIEGLIVSGGALSKDIIIDDEIAMATMSIGSNKKFNFCNKPAAALDTVMLLPYPCHQCGTRYFSDRCKESDSAQHHCYCGCG